MIRPRIGVTTSARSGWRIFPLIAFSVRLAGGHPVRWRVGQVGQIDTVDGLVVGGGDDISADLYGGRLMAEARIDSERDAMERRLIAEAEASGRPVLGICRGAQMLNIVLGGTLHQDIYAAYAGARRLWTVLPRKRIALEPHTLLSLAMGAEPAAVNALHTQSIDRLGRGLRVSARDEAGIVQAVERSDRGAGLMIGVQWHPEHLFYARRQRALFRMLIAAAAAWRISGDQRLAADLTTSEG